MASRIPGKGARLMRAGVAVDLGTVNTLRCVVRGAAEILEHDLATGVPETG